MGEGMRGRWRGSDQPDPLDPLDLSLAELTALVQPAFPGQSVSARELTRGGLSNTNVRLELSGLARPVLLRLYTRDVSWWEDQPRVWAKEAALHRLLLPRGVPVAELYVAAPSNPVTGHAYMLREWLPGERLEIVVRQLDTQRLAVVGQAVGAVLARIHSVVFPRPGSLQAVAESSLPGESSPPDKPSTLDQSRLPAESSPPGESSPPDKPSPPSESSQALTVVPFPPGIPGSGLLEFLQTLLGSRGWQRLGPRLSDALLDFAEREDQFGASWPTSSCLTHADFGGSNILVSPPVSLPAVRSSRVGTQEARVTGVLDWEFAFSGAPFADFGNLMRPPLGDLPGFPEAVAHGYRTAGGVLPDDWLRRARYADLSAWAELLSCPTASPGLVEDARRMIERTLEEW